MPPFLPLNPSNGEVRGDASQDATLAAESQSLGQIVEVAAVHFQLPGRGRPVALVTGHRAADQISLKIFHGLSQ